MTPPAPGPPIDSLLIDTLERVGHALRTQLRAVATEHGLSLTQAQVLMRVASVADSEREPGRLADWFDLSRPTVSEAIAALRRKECVVQEPVVGDRRRTRLSLTPRGQRVAERLTRWYEPIREELTALPHQPKGDALELLLALIGRMQRAGLITVARTCTTCQFFRPHDEKMNDGHCTLLDVPLPPQSLRLDCPDHISAA